MKSLCCTILTPVYMFLLAAPLEAGILTYRGNSMTSTNGPSPIAGIHAIFTLSSDPVIGDNISLVTSWSVTLGSYAFSSSTPSAGLAYFTIVEQGVNHEPTKWAFPMGTIDFDTNGDPQLLRLSIGSANTDTFSADSFYSVTKSSIEYTGFSTKAGVWSYDPGTATVPEPSSLACLGGLLGLGLCGWRRKSHHRQAT
jgi:hypothetical protein